MVNIKIYREFFCLISASNKRHHVRPEPQGQKMSVFMILAGLKLLEVPRRPLG